MADDTPYIIVDNKKIYPLVSPANFSPKIENREVNECQDFGVVDRVTISKEARDKSRLYQAQLRLCSSKNKGNIGFSIALDK